MPVNRCETCKGTGKTKQVIICGLDQNFIGKQDAYERVVINNCPNCGGSGCKWVESEDSNDN